MMSVILLSFKLTIVMLNVIMLSVLASHLQIILVNSSETRPPEGLDTQHNGIPHYDTQHNDIQNNDIQHNDT